ncbi:MAG: nucleotidyltransferase family protein [Thermoleophilia bacterium]|nr:nucleotidyltransferase family protein [Thermoleophilia bacterium]
MRRAYATDFPRFAYVDETRCDNASVDEASVRQLAALGEVTGRLDAARIDHWLFGGWAVDFYAGELTRPHDDVDLAVWLADAPRIAELLARGGWRHAPEEGEDGGTGYERDGVRLELTFLVRGDDGAVAIPLRSGPAVWPEGTFADDSRELAGVRAPLIAFGVLADGKAAGRDDPDEAAKDRADFAVLSRLRP